MKLLIALFALLIAVPVYAGYRNAHIPNIHREQYLNPPEDKDAKGEWVYVGTKSSVQFAKGTIMAWLSGKTDKLPKGTVNIITTTYIWVPEED